MPIQLSQSRSSDSKPVYLCDEKDFAHLPLDSRAHTWVKMHDFTPEAGNFLLIPDEQGGVSAALIGMGSGDNPFAVGEVERILPQGNWHFVGDNISELPYLAALIGAYQFDSYKQKPTSLAKVITLFVPDGVDREDIERQARAIVQARDLINIPANDMGPEALEAVVRQLAADFSARFEVISGDELLVKNFPLIHAVGRVGSQSPRLLDLRWGEPTAPKITLVGKGVCFDTGGLDIKHANGMALMKKDMGGAANVIALARMIMDAGLKVRLRLLIPAVENAISADAMRPGDIIKSRNGLHVEIGNTDAEGRLVLADALEYGGEEIPDLMLDMATLTGAARIALGPDLPPFFSDDTSLVHDVEHFSQICHDPLWHLPLWRPYFRMIHSPFADLNNTNQDGFAGSITAALFLSRFVGGAKSWAHFDIYGWTPTPRPGFPKGGEAQGIRALYALLRSRYGQCP